MRWFEPNLQKILTEAGIQGLRINDIVRNICNLEPALFGDLHPYDEAWKEIYQFLGRESKKEHSCYQRVIDKQTQAPRRGYFRLDPHRLPDESQMKIEF
ncbi:MAG: hypothetical protein GXY64_11675 [Bacteroidales bacterium]|nr:hypothetical protein [Bacteroidales bacterium]